MKVTELLGRPINVVFRKKMIRKLLVTVAMLPAFANAGWIATESKVISVESTSSNRDIFTAVVRGGSGPCVSPSDGDRVILFPRSEAGTSDIHNRTFSMMLAALSSGARVSIYNYADDSCKKAVTVRIIAN